MPEKLRGRTTMASLLIQKGLEMYAFHHPMLIIVYVCISGIVRRSYAKKVPDPRFCAPFTPSPCNQQRGKTRPGIQTIISSPLACSPQATSSTPQT